MLGTRVFKGPPCYPQPLGRWGASVQGWCGGRGPQRLPCLPVPSSSPSQIRIWKPVWDKAKLIEQHKPLDLMIGDRGVFMDQQCFSPKDWDCRPVLLILEPFSGLRWALSPGVENSWWRLPGNMQRKDMCRDSAFAMVFWSAFPVINGWYVKYDFLLFVFNLFYMAR